MRITRTVSLSESDIIWILAEKFRVSPMEIDLSLSEESKYCERSIQALIVVNSEEDLVENADKYVHFKV